MRQIRIGEDVLASDGSRLGEIELIAVDPSAHRVTHVVVAGRMVGVARLRDAGADGLATTLDRAALERLPEARHQHVGGPDGWAAPLGYRLENFVNVAGALLGNAPYVPPVHVDLDALDVHEIGEGSPVWAGDTRLGEVDRVLTGDRGELLELVVQPSRPFASAVRLPAGRVTEVVGNNVHTDLGTAGLEALEPFTEPG